MDKKIVLGVKILSYVFIVLAVIMQVLVMLNGDTINKDNMVEAIASPILNNYFLITVIAFGLALLFSVAFPLVQMISNPKGALKMLGYLVAFVIIGVIAYALAGNSFSEADLTRLKTTVEVSKLVGASIYFTYIVGIGAVGTILYASVSNLFK